MFLRPSTRSATRFEPVPGKASFAVHPQPKALSQSDLNTQETIARPRPRPRRAVSAAVVHKKPAERPQAAPAPAPEEGAEEPADSRSMGRSVPREMMPLFNCEDEEEAEFNNHKYLLDLKVGSRWEFLMLGNNWVGSETFDEFIIIISRPVIASPISIGEEFPNCNGGTLSTRRTCALLTQLRCSSNLRWLLQMNN